MRRLCGDERWVTLSCSSDGFMFWISRTLFSVDFVPKTGGLENYVLHHCGALLLAFSFRSWKCLSTVLV